MDKTAWYVLHVITGEETKIRDKIKKDIVGVSALVPRKDMRERRNGEWERVTRVLFPGYVFIHLHLAVPNYYKIKSYPGVINILGHLCPEPVPDEEMLLIVQLSGEEDPLGISDVYFVDSQVVVKNGPLKGIQGKIVRVEPRRHRAKVEIMLMGEPRIVEMGINLIDKL